jgi:hypothetical protein
MSASFKTQFSTKDEIACFQIVFYYRGHHSKGTYFINATQYQYAQCHYVATMPSVIIPSVFMTSVFMLNIIVRSTVVRSVIIPSVSMISDIILSGIMPIVITLSVIKLRVMVP